MIKKRILKNITDWNPVDERIITVDIKLQGRDLRIIGVYALTDNSDMATQDVFFDELSEQLSKIKSNQGKVDKALDSKVIGRDRENVINDNERRWIELCEQHSLKILNGFFQHRDIYLPGFKEQKN